MFGTQSLVDMGIGASSLSIFNKLTLVGLFDIDSITSISTSSVNYDFVWKYIVLFIIAIAFYFIGSRIFEKKDLPL